MPFNNIITYGSLLDYSPKGSSEIAQKSRQVCGQIKAGRPLYLNRVCEVILQNQDARVLDDILNEEVTLVPIPRSAPLTEGALWPSMVIAEKLLQNGLGHEVLPLIERISPIRKSAYQDGADARPLVPEHMETLQVNTELITPTRITLIDDVVTAGRTAMACAIKLLEVFPDAEISLFAVIRTMSFVPDIDQIFAPEIGQINYFEASGKTRREP